MLKREREVFGKVIMLIVTLLSKRRYAANIACLSFGSGGQGFPFALPLSRRRAGVFQHREKEKREESNYVTQFIEL